MHPLDANGVGTTVAGMPSVMSCCLPQSRDAIGVEGLLVGNEYEIFQHRLGDQHLVERVAESARQSARHLPMPKVYRQSDKALIGDHSVEICDNGGNSRQFTDAMLRRYFPD